MATFNTFPVWRYLGLWILAMILALCGLAALERHNLVRELTTKSVTLHRLASQRADQHDAHLTSLSAIFVAGGVARRDLFLDVTATIMRFYPRIISVNVIALDAENASIETLRRLGADDTAAVIEMAKRSTGALQLGQMPSQPDHYMIVKRSPNTNDARHALTLVVDAHALLAAEDAFWQNPAVSLRLLMPDRQAALIGPETQAAAGFTKPLGSASQPLVFESALTLALGDVLPLGRAVFVCLLVSVLSMLCVFAVRQRARTREAEGRARLSAQETRLAHASRVNAMGEMASGMAHELAQPLTAILSQAQAGRHLVRRGDLDRLGAALDDTVDQAQRAANILDRLRHWSRPNRATAKPCALHEAVRSVELLLAADAKNKGATITLALLDAPLLIDADPVALEQVVFNLVRNALDACDAARVTIRTAIEGRTAILDVTDNGPGVPDAIRQRVFEPFITGKPEGTGLGLALCQRLVEDMGGEIELLSNAPQTTFRLSLPLSATHDSAGPPSPVGKSR